MCCPTSSPWRCLHNKEWNTDTHPSKIRTQNENRRHTESVSIKDYFDVLLQHWPRTCPSMSMLLLSMLRMSFSLQGPRVQAFLETVLRLCVNYEVDVADCLLVYQLVTSPKYSSEKKIIERHTILECVNVTFGYTQTMLGMLQHHLTTQPRTFHAENFDSRIDGCLFQ